MGLNGVSVRVSKNLGKCFIKSLRDIKYLYIKQQLVHNFFVAFARRLQKMNFCEQRNGQFNKRNKIIACRTLTKHLILKSNKMANFELYSRTLSDLFSFVNETLKA